MKKNLKSKSNLKRKRKHGFRRRSATKAGKRTLSSRRRKGRHALIPS